MDLPDGAVKTYAANTIADNILSQVDVDGYHNQILDCIIDHQKGSKAVDKQDQWFVKKRGNCKMRQTTVGCQFQVKFKYDTTI